MGFDKLSEEVRKKLYSCETPEELIKTASEYGVELSEAELSMINGGTDSFRSIKENMLIRLETDDRTGFKRPDKDNMGLYPG